MKNLTLFAVSLIFLPVSLQAAYPPDVEGLMVEPRHSTALVPAPTEDFLASNDPGYEEKTTTPDAFNKRELTTLFQQKEYKNRFGHKFGLITYEHQQNNQGQEDIQESQILSFGQTALLSRSSYDSARKLGANESVVWQKNNSSDALVATFSVYKVFENTNDTESSLGIADFALVHFCRTKKTLENTSTLIEEHKPKITAFLAASFSIASQFTIRQLQEESSENLAPL